MIAVAAASGAMAVALPVSAAFAADGAAADGSAVGSPGLISGNSIQLPVQVPVNLCGNTVNVVGLLNPAAGNRCENSGGGGTGGPATSGGAATQGGASAQGGASDSPGVISGNGIQLPVDLPVNVSGNSVDVVGLLNPAEGNQSVDAPGGDHPRTPPPPRAPEPPTPPAPKPPTPGKSRPAPQPSKAVPQQTVSTLAHTGTDVMAPAVAGSAALLVAGTILYRRFRPGRTG
ncbi:hypothetical protein LK08_10875 [Streptomyces sp. MUSC 125]|nr:hypothetical protein LK06_030530 [Streptomyces pluripotens]KIE26767.1 hypothetical protein LK08_10875 [Streptomyces sp. MUSC 125]